MMEQEARKGGKSGLMYKCLLQEYAQKECIPPPVYEFVKAEHEASFKATVTFNGVTYESPPGFPSVRDAEQAAAKAAVEALLQTTDATEVLRPVRESGLCKCILEAYARENGLLQPVYQSQRFGDAQASVFYSSVEIAGVTFTGGPTKRKKLAEVQAAWLAFQSAQLRDVSPNLLDLPPHVQSEVQLGSDSTNTVSSGDPASFDWRKIPQYRDFTSYETL